MKPGCKIDDCAEQARSRGWCNPHYQSWYRYGDPLRSGRAAVSTSTTCSVDDCDQPRYQRRLLCSTHAMRLHRYDDVHVSKDRTGNTWAMSNGYLRTALNAPALLRDNDGGTAVHRMVLLEAIGEGTHECHWCGTSVTWKHFDKQSWDGVLVADHLDGNRANNEASNLVPACFSCNILRGRWGNEWVLNRGRRD